MSHDDFLFKILPISNERFLKIVQEIQHYYSIIQSSHEAKISAQSHKTVINVIINDLIKHCPELMKYVFLTLNCGKIYEIKYIHRFSNEPQLPHVDYVTERFELATDSYLALNFPVKNCESCRVYFCEPIGKIQEEKRYLGKNYRAKVGHHDEWKILDEYYLTTPTLINTNVYHNIENITDETRVSLSIRFEKNPWHLI